MLDEDAAITARMHFGAFGERQDMNWQSAFTGYQYALNDIITRGFTGHEQVDSMGIVHMNGRIYDPKLGRFLQADPVVQAPKNSQSLNRYSYVLNNPLSYTDPSGYFSIKTFAKLVVGAVAAYFTFGATYAWAATALANSVAAGSLVLNYAAVTTAAAVIGGAAAGFVGGAIISGTVKGALNGAILGGITAGLNAGFSNSGLNDSISRGLSGGINGALENGDSEGFLRGYFAAQLSIDLGIERATGSRVYYSSKFVNFATNRVREYMRGHYCPVNFHSITI